MTTVQQQKNKSIAKAIRELKRREATESLSAFIKFTYPEYDAQWFHELICYYIEQLLKREIKKLMIFVPPQHGKTEISSRRFPAYALGKNPKEKIMVASYNSTKAGEFVVDTSRIIKSKEYKEVFSKTVIAGKDSVEKFEINEGEGFYKGGGIDGGFTGTSATIGIIDDPFKGRNEANSKTQRDRVWNFYQDDFKTRLDNNGVQLLLFTRWHEDDIAGRILNPKSEYYNEQEASEWTVIALPALKEETKPLLCALDVNDPREIGEALWEAKHSKEKYELRRLINPTGFNSLDQQRPSAEGGNKLKKEYFTIKNESELPFNIASIIPKFIIDGAFTESTKNDESAIMTYYKHRGVLYILNATAVRKELYEFLKFFKQYARSNGWRPPSTVWIEPKASGKDMRSMLSKFEYGGFNCREIHNDAVKLGKWNRAELTEPFLASGKVVLVKGAWNKAFIDQCGEFPNGTHDDLVDDLCYSVWLELIKDSDGAGGVTYEN